MFALYGILTIETCVVNSKLAQHLLTKTVRGDKRLINN